MITTKGRTMNRLTYKQTNVALQPVVAQRLKEPEKRKIAAPPKRVILLLLLLSTLFWAAGCEDYHSSSPGYAGSSAYYAGDSADFLDHDRLYYRGPGYWYGRVAACIMSGSQVTGHGGPVSFPRQGRAT